MDNIGLYKSIQDNLYVWNPLPSKSFVEIFMSGTHCLVKVLLKSLTLEHSLANRISCETP